jgi:hypothetical protein
MTATWVTDQMRDAEEREFRRRVSFPVAASDIRRWAVAVYYPDLPPRQFWDADHAKTRRHGGLVAPEEFNPFAWLTADILQSANPTAPVYPVAAGYVEEALGIEPPPLTKNISGGISVRYGGPIRPDDIITSTVRLIKYYEKEGRLGRMLFTITEDGWLNQHGAHIKTMTETSIRYE